MRILSSILPSLVLWLCILSPASAFDPVANTILPRGGQTGTEVQFKIIGNRLDNVQELILYRDGITVSDLKNESLKEVHGTFTIAADAPLGEHPFRVRTKEGVSYLRTFWVMPLPSVQEEASYDKKKKKRLENNNTFESPQHIKLNSIVHGVIDIEDTDYYSFSGKKGQRISAEIFGMRLGRVKLDPYLAILDSKRFELATCDDTVLTKRDPFLSLTLPADGDYTLLARESSYQGSLKSNYLLQLSEAPRPTSAHPPLGKPGEKIELTFKGPTGETKQTVTLPQTEGLTSIYSKHQGRLAPSPNPLLVTKTPIIIEQEPNNKFQSYKGKSHPLPVIFHGVINSQSESQDRKQTNSDWFRFSAKKGDNIRLQVHARALRSPLDAIIQIRDGKSHKFLFQNDDNGRSPDSKLDFKVPADGDYLLMIRDHLWRSGPDFTYAIEVSPQAPTLSAEMPYSANRDSQKNRAIAIPRGSHLAIAPNVTRRNTGCEVILEYDKLPKGVTVQSKPAPKNPTNFPILFSATKDAPLGSTLTAFHIKDSQSNLRGALEDNIHHLETNAGTFCSTFNKRLAIAVIEEAPFSLSIIPPSVPLVQSGTMSLVIKAKRKNDFKAPIKIKLPWHPPGVGVVPEVTIPENKDEITIPINANPEAPIRQWSVCVTGEAETGRGQVRLSSPFVELEIAEPYLTGSIDLATTKLGNNVTLICELENLKSFSGEAELLLHGLPHQVTAKSVKIKATDKKVKIPLTVPQNARAGKSKNIFAEVKIKQGGSTISHQIAQGTTLVITPSTKK